MHKLGRPRNRATMPQGLLVLLLLACPLPARGQEVAREALASFPADTRQLVCTNLAELRYSSDYPRIRNRILNGQLRAFADFLGSLGIDPDRDVDEVILGWRSQAEDSFFALARGNFQPDRLRQEFTMSHLPTRNYGGMELYAFGTGADPHDLFFTFLDSSLAAFGRWPNVKALLGVRQGDLPSLESNQAFADWEHEEEGTAPQWGVMTGRSAANLAAGWLAAGKEAMTDLSPFLSPVEAVLYSVDWDGGFTAELSVICQNREAASALSTLLKVWQAAPARPALGPLLTNMEAHQDGSRLLISLSGPAGASDSVFRP